MLELRTYTRQELIELFETERIDSIKNKLNRQGYTYATSGRGQDYTLTITALPPRFRNYCIDVLGFAPQTDFERLKHFLYMFFFDKEFQQLPLTTMSHLLNETIYVSRQTLGNWINKLIDKGIIHKSNVEFNYFAFGKDQEGNDVTLPITKEIYVKAWNEYWKGNEYSYCEALSRMRTVVTGTPHKYGVICENAFYLDTVNELKDILRKELL